MENLVLSQIRHRPVRTIVTCAGIGLGVLLVVFTRGMTEGSLRERAAREANIGAQLIMRASGSTGLSGSESFILPVENAEKLLKVEGVKNAVAIGQTTVTAKDNVTGSRLLDGVDFDSYKAITSVQLHDGRQMTSGDELMISTSWQEQKGRKIGDKIPMWERDFTIVGTFEPAAGAQIKIPLKTLQDQLGSEGKCSSILISLNDGASDDDVGERIKATFPDSQLLRTKDMEEIYMNGIPFLSTFLDVVVGISTLISALVILLTMYTTVTERTRQIGILKSLGFSRAGIGWIIVQESMLLSALGVLTGVASAFILKFVLTKFTTLQVSLNLKLIGIALVVALLGSVVGALYPAMRAAKLDAVEALGYE